MKILLFTLVASLLLFSCGTTRKAVNKLSQEVRKTGFFERDSSVNRKTDSLSVKIDTASISLKTDSTYEKRIEEEITEYTVPADTSIKARMDHSTAQNSLPPGTRIIKTKRSIYEKGNKKTEQAASTKSIDSTRKSSLDHASKSETSKTDSSGKTTSSNKTVKRTRSNWWIWLLLATGTSGYAWYRRHDIKNFIIKKFSS